MKSHLQYNWLREVLQPMPGLQNPELCSRTYTHTHTHIQRAHITCTTNTHTHARMHMQFMKLQLNFTKIDGILRHLTYCNPCNRFCFPCRIICVSMKFTSFNRGQKEMHIRPKMLSVTQPQLTWIVWILLHCDIKTYVFTTKYNQMMVGLSSPTMPFLLTSCVNVLHPGN